MAASGSIPSFRISESVPFDPVHGELLFRPQLQPRRRASRENRSMATRSECATCAKNLSAMTVPLENLEMFERMGVISPS
jgi:hypothetical protein